MNKYKICVYAICKNEEKFVDRWYSSIKEADYIYVLDTGSTDNTVEKLKNHGIIVNQKIIKPWRFDVARNISLDLIPDDTDICVCLDLDEVMSDNWREELEKIWNKDITRLKYNYNWSLDENNKPLINFYIEKIHSRNNYKWINPVHEILKYTGDKEKFELTDKITVNHYPDSNKSRSSYLSLLELSVKEDPSNDRNVHYLGREYMFYKEYNKAIDTLIKHLNLKTSTWKDERCASMRYIARCYIALNRFYEAEMWFKKACSEAPYLREPYIELAYLYGLNNIKLCKKYCFKALKLEEKKKTYINEPFTFNDRIYDLLSICNYHENNYKASLKWINKALSIDSNNKRLLENKKLIIEKMNSI